ncbi:hypothetical protein GWD52_16600 [Enterobacteriaceae bacterium 4M9]|nr:hypothetical protein [Enterobacteriaceae bacterium 4M9]
MFTSVHFFHIATLSALVLLMPGPTNTLLLSSGAIVGFIRTLKLIAAEIAGYLIAISAWGFFLMGLSKHAPWTATVIKCLAAGYVAWMAVKVWNIYLHVDSGEKIAARNVFVTTLLNPKAFVFASYIMPVATFTSGLVFGYVMLAFTSALLPVSVCWSLAGKVLIAKGSLVPGINPQRVFRCASLVLCVFSVTLFYDVVR